jgi:septal ring factor EnvC (AmiA/AmiB activator)
MDRFVVERIKLIGRDPKVVRETLEAARKAQAERRPEIQAELKEVAQERRRLGEQRENLLDAIADGAGTAGSTDGAAASVRKRLEKVERQVAEQESRAADLRADLAALDGQVLDEDALRAALSEFTALWDQLHRPEQRRLLALLLENVTYHAGDEEVALTFNANGLRSFQKEARA